ncbi:MAG: HAMP domain-containing protein [Anaerolineae bacterium]|nr:HAMP domain-containing protein [Anaerolineae bacterium]NUQ03411.1 HAMP domain-containing protein [Anaerolineae bacterium]
MTQEPSSRKPLFISVRARLVIGLTLLFSIVFIGGFLIVYQFASDRAMDRLAEDLRVLLEGTAGGIDGDAFASVARFGEPNEAGYSDDPRFWIIVDWLASIKAVDYRTGIYTIALSDRLGEYVLIASAAARTEPDDPETARFQQPLGYAPGDAPAFDALFNGETSEWLLLEPYQDDFGYWISGYESIKNAAGEPVGVVGIDYRAEYVFSVQRQILDAALPSFLIGFAVFFIVVYLISIPLTRPITTLTLAAERIGEGDYSAPLPKASRVVSDEFSILADVFRVMVGKVQGREVELRKQVEELKIEIDETKARAQVAEIVDTDFFASLQEKAKHIRSRRDDPPPVRSSQDAETQPRSEG